MTAKGRSDRAGCDSNEADSAEAVLIEVDTEVYDQVIAVLDDVGIKHSPSQALPICWKHLTDHAGWGSCACPCHEERAS